MIRLSKLADYAVIVLTTMARENAQIHSAHGIAMQTGLGLPTVSKILKLLAGDGILTSARGSHGGYSFARDITLITATDVIEAVDGKISVTECAELQGGDCRVESLCPTKHAWIQINNKVRNALSEITLAELAGVKSAKLENAS